MLVAVAALGLIANVSLPTNHLPPAAQVLQSTQLCFGGVGGGNPPTSYLMPDIGDTPIATSYGSDLLHHGGWKVGESFHIDLVVSSTGATVSHTDDWGTSNQLSIAGTADLIGNVWFGSATPDPLPAATKTIVTRTTSTIKSDFYYEYQATFTMNVGTGTNGNPIFKTGKIGLGILQYAGIQ